MEADIEWCPYCQKKQVVQIYKNKLIKRMSTYCSICKNLLHWEKIEK